MRMPTDEEVDAIAKLWEPSLWDGRYQASMGRLSYTPEEIQDFVGKRRDDARKSVRAVFTHAEQVMK